MLARAGGMAAAVMLAAAPSVADAARTLSYQGYTSQGHQIAFKRSGAGVFSMKIAVRANCANDQSQNERAYDFSLRAVDTVADTVKRGKFTTKFRYQVEGDRLVANQDLKFAGLQVERAKTTGDSDVKLGAAYLSYGMNDKAIEALTRGIGKGGVKDPDEAGMLLGIAYLRTGKKDEAGKAFATVTKSPVLVRVAKFWMVDMAGAAAAPATPAG